MRSGEKSASAHLPCQGVDSPALDTGRETRSAVAYMRGAQQTRNSLRTPSLSEKAAHLIEQEADKGRDDSAQSYITHFIAMRTLALQLVVARHGRVLTL